MARRKKRSLSFEKLVVYVNCAVPAALLLFDALRGRLGANPVDFLTKTTGMLTLVFLTLSLAVTPARHLLDMASLAQHRRTIGLYAFFYGCLHLLTYTGFDKAFSLSAITADTFARPFIFVGMGSFLLMAPLAATSTNAMIKRLGGKAWRRLHRLVYVVGIGGVVHYYLLVKVDTTYPFAFAVVIAALLAFRIYVAFGGKTKPKRTPQTLFSD